MVRKLLSILLCLLLIFYSSFKSLPVHAQENTAYNLAVMELDPIGINADEARVLSDNLRSQIIQLINSGKLPVNYNILESNQMDAIFEQFEIQNINNISDSAAVEFGKMLQVELLVVGSLGHVGKTFTIHIRLVDVRSSKTIKSSEYKTRGSIEKLLETGIPKVARDLLLKTKFQLAKKEVAREAQKEVPLTQKEARDTQEDVHFTQEEVRGLKKKMASQAGKRWAICIGINNYADRKLNSLKKAANDAYGLASIFQQQGDFKIATISDVDENGQVKPLNGKFLPTKRGIEDYLKQIETFQDIKPNDLVVFSFSGHGISDKKGMNYLLPSDWQNERPYESAIPLNTITDWLHKLGVTKSLFLVDACREEMSSSRSLDSMSRLYTNKFESAQVAAVFFATKQGGFSYEDPNSNYGAFTRFLIDGLYGQGDIDKDGLVTFRELSTYVENNLGDWARNNNYMQRPFTRILGEQSGDLALTLAR